MLPAGSLNAVPPHPGIPKHAELIGIINKPLLLHLVGVYIIVLPHKHEAVKAVCFINRTKQHKQKLSRQNSGDLGAVPASTSTLPLAF